MSKYLSKKVELDGFKFDSKIESNYYIYLKDLKQLWVITDFKIHPTYILQNKFENKGIKYHAIKYLSDFEVYYATGDVKVIDIKGMPTSDAKLKRKMFIYLYPDKELVRLVKYKNDRVEYFANDKRRKLARKERMKKSKKSLACVM